MEEEILQLTKDLVKAPSTKGESINAARIYYDFLEEHGLNPTLDEYKEGEGNVYAQIGPSTEDPIVISGHLDTVPIGNREEWTHDPYSAKIIDGELWGRGSVDMKGGTATLAGVMVNLLEHEDDLSQPVFLAATAEEETGLKGAEEYVKKNLFSSASHILIAEPTDLVANIREKGIIWFDVHAYGKQAHASRPELGHNSIEGLAGIIPRLKEVIPEKVDPELGRTSFNTGIIEGGTAANVVAQYARARFDSRTTPGVDNQEYIQKLQQVVEDLSGNDGVRFEFELIEDAPSILSKDNTFAKLLSEETAKFTGVKSDLGGVHYATDGAIFMGHVDHQAQFVIYGPGSTELLHQTNERLEVKQLEIALAAYTNSLIQTLVN